MFNKTNALGGREPLNFRRVIKKMDQNIDGMKSTTTLHLWLKVDYLLMLYDLIHNFKLLGCQENYSTVIFM